MTRTCWTIALALALGCQDSGQATVDDAAADSGHRGLADALRVDDAAADAVRLLDVALAADAAPDLGTDVGGDAAAPSDDAAAPPVNGEVIEPGTPADAPTRFDEAPEDEGCAPELIYPEPLTTFPRNMTGLRFQWRRADFELFKLDLRVGDVGVRWFTGGEAVTPEGDNWALVLRRAQGGAFEARLSGLRDGRVCRGPAITLFVDPSALVGAVYYWSTTDFGIMRLAQGDTEPEPFLTQGVAPEINCPACHALSRDGSRIAFTRTLFPPFGDLVTAEVETPRQFLYDPGGVAGYFPSFAPDNRRLVAGSGGQLLVRDTDTSMEIERLPMPQDRVGGAPDWSWQGERIVAAFGASGLANAIPDVGINAGGLAEWRLQDDGTWTEPELLMPLPMGGELSSDRPAYSPDGAWIGFERRGADPDDETAGNPTASLWAMPTGGGDPVRLDRGNGGPGNGNSWPKWAVTDNRGKLWLAFSSLRAYGDVKSFGNPQIWVVAIDPEAPPGADPSSPAFWLPFQDPESGNHIPYWAVYDKE